MNDPHLRNVIIVGSGPAAHTAAIYAARASLRPLLFEGLVDGGVPGGQLVSTGDVENFPGFAGKIAGPDLAKAFRAQAVAQGVEIVTDDVRRIDLALRPFTVAVGEDDVPYATRTLILATGAQVNWLGLESEAALQGRGVSACGLGDGAFFRDQDVVVVGGGDTALQEATHLAGICRSVTLVHRRAHFRASEAMRDRALCHPKIRVLYETVVDEILDVSRGEVTGARVRQLATSASTEIACQGFFVAIGHRPNTDLVRGQIELCDRGYVKTVPGTTRTSVPGVFACGRVQDRVYRQAITAAGTGCMAALDAERWIAGEGSQG